MAFRGWNFGDLFDAMAGTVAPDQPALIHGDRQTTWREFDQRTNNLGRALLAGGAQPGEKLALYLRNHPAYIEGVVAGFKARQVHVNVNYRYVADEVRYILDNSDAATVIFAREFSSIVAQIRSLLPNVRQWLMVEDGSDVSIPAFAKPFETLAMAGSGEPLAVTRSPDDLFFIYTGGTTGLPKGVVWRQDALRRSMLNPALVSRVPEDVAEHLAIVKATGPGHITVPACPLMHGTGLLTCISALLGGGTVVTLASGGFDAHDLWAAVQKHRVTQIALVGDVFSIPMLRALEEAKGRYDVSSMKSILSSGTIWSAEVKQRLLHFMPQIALTDTLGSSEAVGVGLSIMTAENMFGTAQFQITEKAKVFSPEGREIAPGTGEGGLIARSEPLAEGYYKDPKKTAEIFKVIDGVRYGIPGDFCVVDADGMLTLMGRGSGCINTGGEKVFPEEVEEVLKLHAHVDDALVVGVPDPKWGQAVIALIESSPGVTFDEAALRQHVRQHLSGYKTPKRLIEVPAMTRSVNGKADYKAAREVALRVLERSA
ncbi:MAG: AMP-dependent synthetase and ligase [Bradyrhizobium sp.]|nr:AMP-dependent synthetase and ligase [Bradyrhizobium sp.]